MLPMLILGTLAVVAAGLVCWRRRPPTLLMHFRCPGCDAKVRYRMGQAGKQGQCSCCKKTWTVPAIPEDEDEQEVIRRYRVRRLPTTATLRRTA